MSTRHILQPHVQPPQQVCRTTLMLLTRLHRPQSLSQAWATATQLRGASDKPYFRRFRPQQQDDTSEAVDAPEQRTPLRENGPYRGSRSIRIDHEAKPASNLAQELLEAQPEEPSEPPLTLFQELFPEEAKKTPEPPKPTPPRQAYLPREFDWAKTSDGALPIRQKPSMGQSFPDLDVDRQRRDAAVLVLSNASKSLTQSDFLRLSPKGQHISNWLSGILKIIPARDPQTLSPLGHYFILFSSTSAAQAYADTVIRLHQIARTYTPTGWQSKMMPPPGWLKNGEDIHKLMQEFTLVPASQKTVSLRLLQRPHQPSVQRLIEAGGHPALVARQRKCENLVLVNLEKASDYDFVPVYELRRWLALQGRKRGMPWGLTEDEDAIVRLDGKSENDEDQKHPVYARERFALRSKKRLPSRFVLSFKESLEARRFVRDWHKRRFEVDTRGDIDEVPIVIQAELLW